jgi:hypothetical protein
VSVKLDGGIKQTKQTNKKLICLSRHMQAGVSVFAKAGEGAECKVSCCERMHVTADSVHDVLQREEAVR